MSTAFAVVSLATSGVMFLCALALVASASWSFYRTGRPYLRDFVEQACVAVFVAFVSGCAFVPPLLKLLGKV